MDELDLKIFRTLLSERAVAPSKKQVSSSLRSIATRIGVDDMTVNYRYKRLQKTGALSGWRLLVNPTFFGCRMLDVTVDVQPESAKSDMIRKLKLVHEVTGIFDFYGKAMKVILIYNSEQSRSRTIELISRITNAEAMTQLPLPLPQCRTERLTEADVAVIRALSNDARRNLTDVAKEVGLSATTVRNRLGRLRMESTVFAFPTLNMVGIPGLIPVYLSYSYAAHEAKALVDRKVLSHFEKSYISVEFSGPDGGRISLSASTMTDVQEYLEWVKSQQGVAGARVDIITKTMMFPEKMTELLDFRNEKAAIQRKAFY